MPTKTFVGESSMPFNSKNIRGQVSPYTLGRRKRLLRELMYDERHNQFNKHNQDDMQWFNVLYCSCSSSSTPIQPLLTTRCLWLCLSNNKTRAHNLRMPIQEKYIKVGAGQDNSLRIMMHSNHSNHHWYCQRWEGALFFKKWSKKISNVLRSSQEKKQKLFPKQQQVSLLSSF